MTQAEKQAIMKEYATHEGDTGSPVFGRKSTCCHNAKCLTDSIEKIHGTQPQQETEDNGEYDIYTP